MEEAMIRDLSPQDIGSCVDIAMGSALSEVYGFTRDGWTKKLEDALGNSDNVLFVAEFDGFIAGFAWASAQGAFLVAPYLRFIAVDPRFRGKGIGKRLLETFEEKMKGSGKDFVLLVSDFNFEAQSMYERHGYRNVGHLKDFAVPGVTEFIMVKKRNRGTK